jgi:hypothetical protein
MSTRLIPPTQHGLGRQSDRAQRLADLRRRFVALPDQNNPTGWLVDLRDPFHPVVVHYATWAEAEDAADALIMQLLYEGAGHK